MTWADLLIAGGQFVLGLVLLPTILDPNAHVPRKTSVPTALVLTAFLPAFWELGAPVSVAGTSLVAIGWWFVAGLRGGGAS